MMFGGFVPYRKLELLALRASFTGSAFVFVLVCKAYTNVVCVIVSLYSLFYKH